MRKISLILLFALLLAACSATPTPVVVVPTLAVLPSATATPSWTPAPLPTQTDSPSPVPSSTLTPLPSDTETPLPTATLAPSATDTDTATATSTETYTFTPSLTITNTITPTPSPTFTPSPELDGLGVLALLSQRATVLPPELQYNPQTLTAVAFAAQTLVAAGTTFAPTAPPVDNTGGSVIGGDQQLATLPPPMVGGGTGNTTTTTCLSPLPGGLSGAFAADPSLTQAIGCPQGQTISTTAAVQSFEHGTMIYVQGSPGSIYVLTADGRFRRFDDTWVSGVDPETGGETPPLGLIEPKRGFGKVWRNNLDVRGSLGWGVTEEAGAQSSLLLFDRGRAVYLPTLGSTYLLIDDPGGASGSWRIVSASF